MKKLRSNKGGPASGRHFVGSPARPPWLHWEDVGLGPGATLEPATPAGHASAALAGWSAPKVVRRRVSVGRERPDARVRPARILANAFQNGR